MHVSGEVQCEECGSILQNDIFELGSISHLHYMLEATNGDRKNCKKEDEESYEDGSTWSLVYFRIHMIYHKRE